MLGSLLNYIYIPINCKASLFVILIIYVSLASHITSYFKSTDDHHGKRKNTKGRGREDA